MLAISILVSPDHVLICRIHKFLPSCVPLRAITRVNLEPEKGSIFILSSWWLDNIEICRIHTFSPFSFPASTPEFDERKCWVQERKISSSPCWAGGAGWSLFSGQWKTNRGADRWDKRTQASFSKKSLGFIKHCHFRHYDIVPKHICYFSSQTLQARQNGKIKHCIFSFMLPPIPSNCKSNKWEHNLI